MRARPAAGAYPPTMSTPTALTDGFGRVHRSLRVSVTDRCNLRCRYCMPAEGMRWIPREELLSDDELVRLVPPRRISLDQALEFVRDECTLVEDGLSRNGTFVQDRRVVGRTRLADGDLIRVDAVAGTLEVLVPAAEWAARTPVTADLSASHSGVGRELFRGALLQDLALEEQVGPVRDTEGFLHVVVGDEHADVALLQMRHNALDVLHGNGVHACKGFVEQDEFRFSRQAPRDLRAPAFPPAEHVAHVLSHMLQAELVQQAFQLPVLLRLG